MAAQKFLAPFKKLPQQVQNLPLFRKAEAKFGKHRSDLFGCHLSSSFGYPEQPSALAYDSTLKLIAIGTHKGDLKILGAPGVEFQAVHSNADEVCKIVFIPNQGRLITLTGDNKLHFWEFDDASQPPVWNELKTLDLTEKTLGREGCRVTAISLSQDSEILFLGTEGGLLQKVHVKDWKLDDESVNSEAISSSLEEDKRSGLKFGEVVAVEAHPSNPAHLLLGYSEGLLVLYNISEGKATHFFPVDHALESVSWCNNGDNAVASYCDGSFLVWQVDENGGIINNAEPPKTPYGPFPCEAIKKVTQRKSDKFGTMTIFSGGMPKASYSGRHTVSVTTDSSESVCFNFSSQVIDFVTLENVKETPVCNGDTEETIVAHEGSVGTLLVMLEHEIVAVDLTKEGWPLHNLPYLSCINTSFITALGQAEAVSAEVISMLESCNDATTSAPSSSWPILGGEDKRMSGSAEEGAKSAAPTCTDLLLTGHEDGSVAIWKLGYGDVFHRLATVPTACLYDSSSSAQGQKNVDNPNDGDEAWLPFRQVGKFQPAIEEDVRLCVTRVQLIDNALVVGGMAGQASVWRLVDSDNDVEVDVLKIGADLIEDRERYEWKSAGALKVHEGSHKFQAGFQPEVLLQLEPPSEVTAVAFQPTWELLAVGTAHGFVVVDTRQKKVAHTHASVFDTHEIQPHALLVKGRKIQTSMRQSFKRLRKMVPRPGAAASPAPVATAETAEKKETEEDTVKKEGETPAAEAAPAPAVVETPAAEEAAPSTEDKKEEPVAEAASAEKKEEVAEETAAAAEPTPEPVQPLALSSGDVTTALIRCLLFTETYIVSPHEKVASLWLGSQAGCTYILSITLPTAAERDTTEVKVVLSKSLSLQHGAPVVGIAVIDAKTRSAVVVERSNVEAPKASPEPGKEEPAAEAPAETNTAAQKPPTPGGGSSTIEHHDVIICSEEQIKIFSLPHLKPKHKYKVLTDKSVSMGAGGSDPEARTGTIDKAQLSKTATIDRCPTDDTAAARHRIKSFGVQRFRQGSTEEWNAVIALADGLFYILALPSLRKQFNDCFTPDKESFFAMTCVGHSDANVVMTLHGAGQVRVTDVSQQTPSHYGTMCTINLPEGARPKKEEPVVAAEPAPAVEGVAAEGLETVEEGMETAEAKELGFSVDGLEPVVEEVADVDTAETAAKAEAASREAAIQEVAKETVEATIIEAKKEAGEALVAREEALEAKANDTVEGAIKEAKQELMSMEQTVNNTEEAHVESKKAEDEPTVKEVTEKLDNTHVDDTPAKTTQHIGDITMDSIKEYTNNDDDVTVKTFSSTTKTEECVTKVIEDDKIIKEEITKTVDCDDAPVADVTAGGD